MKQIAERLVKQGHQVTVATSKLSNRDFSSLNGVLIKEFAISGNLVRGILGDQNDYRQYLVSTKFDVLMIKAAQQWTFDALWPVLDNIKFLKFLFLVDFLD